LRGHWAIVAFVTLALGLWASPRWRPVLVDRSPTSPFSLFGRDDLRVGRRFAFYESVARKEHHRPFRCTRLWARAHACTVRTTDIPALITLVVDSSDRVILLAYSPSARLRVGEQYAPAQYEPGVSAAILAELTANTKTAWDSIGSSVDTSSTWANGERWEDPTGRWTARVWYAARASGPQPSAYGRELLAELPARISVADEPRVRALVRARPLAIGDQDPPNVLEELAYPVHGDAQKASLPTHLLSATDRMHRVETDLRTLLAAQDLYHSHTYGYTRDLSLLKFVPSAGVDIEFGSVTAHGWVATATTASWENRSCVVWQGAVGHRPRTARGRYTEKPSEIVCDAL
jgi:hypothetical protein